MKDEIKEILERPNVYSFNDECYLYFGDYNKLKDYITNLQEENKRLKNENQDFVVEQNALAYYLVKQGLSFEDIVKIINDFKNE